jgi:D-3-phosphoglycerate dehydrogenase
MTSPKAEVAASPKSSSISVRDHILNVRRGSINDRPPRFLQPVENGGIRLLMLENISQEAVIAFRALGFHVDHYTAAMSEDELVQKIGSYHAIGIRSKTKITSRIIQAAPKVRLLHSGTQHPSYVAISSYSYWSLDVSALARTKSI